MVKKEKFKLRQSLLVGALTSSFGVFISKALGLLYYSPLNSIAGEENMFLYSIAYTYYDLLLKISSAGIPFAIAALVAKYASKDDYKTVLLVKKLGISLVMALSLLCAFIFILASGPIASQSLGVNASASDINHLKNLYLILIVAAILVPYLSSIRGYYQGLKRLDLYASSQVLEQFVRVVVIILGAFICVNVIKLESVYAIYAAISAAAIAALVAIIYFKASVKQDDERIDQLVKSQRSKALTSKAVYKEIFSLGVPYLLISFLGTSGPIIDTTFFLDYATTKGGMSQELATLSLGILQANCSKLLAIPQVLTSGFCAGLVPYLTESLEKKDYPKLSKQVVQILDTVLFILVPVLFIFFFFAEEIYSIMYGYKNLELGAYLFRVSCAKGFTETILPIMSSIMITLLLKKESIFTLASCFLMKFAFFYVCVQYLGAAGMTASSCMASIISMAIYASILKKKFKIKLKPTYRRFFIIVVCSAIMIIPSLLLRRFIINDYTSRLFSLLLMSIYGIICLLVYYLVSIKCNLPQIILGIENPSIVKLIKKIIKK